jgi:hypothetical protein
LDRCTIDELLSGRHHPHNDPGGCLFDYTVTPVPLPDAIEVVAAENADAEALRWFPHLQRGMESGWKDFRERHDRLLMGVRIAVEKVHDQPVNKTASGCERSGRGFILRLARRARCMTGGPGWLPP